MITTKSKKADYLVQFTNGLQRGDADASPGEGGGGAGFGAHELLEASLACCINMWIRRQADRLGLPVSLVAVSVSLIGDHPDEATFEYSVKLEGALSGEQRMLLMAAAENCPVRGTLAKKLSFRHCPS